MSMAVRDGRCVQFPSKRRFALHSDADRAAEVRSKDTGLDIRARECVHCSGWHLAEFGDDKPLADLHVVEPDHVSEAIVVESPDIRLRHLSAWLTENPTPSTDDLVQQFGWHRKTIAGYMHTLGYVVNRGPGARWDKPAKLELVPPTEPEEPVDLSVRRHPASMNAGWEVVARDDLVRDVTIGSFIDSLSVAGVEVRIQIRRKS